ncbi:PEP-CTERM sorting domain-containing protein [Aquincola sp. MAHUQ-54]|uniref:PEP-CTERM sorting domain-containing protein n=1 Tax=Aquincola agrisoli TaxID=3119538 RepID=A0AAW9QD89_9BURK
MKFITAAVLAAFAAAPALAAPLVIDFETAPSFESIGEHYADWGVSFTGDALGLQNDFEQYFSNAPSPLGVMTPVGADATMNVAAGFVDQVSFSYSSSSLAVSAVNVWSGLNGTGELLASFNLVGNAQAGGCSDTAFCRFDTLTSTFAGTAHSLTFGNAANLAVFDNISVTAVPEPASVLMMALGLAGLAAVSRRRG